MADLRGCMAGECPALLASDGGGGGLRETGDVSLAEITTSATRALQCVLWESVNQQRGASTCRTSVDHPLHVSSAGLLACAAASDATEKRENFMLTVLAGVGPCAFLAAIVAVSVAAGVVHALDAEWPIAGTEVVLARVTSLGRTLISGMTSWRSRLVALLCRGD